MPHLVCLGNDRFKAEDQLIDLRYAGFTDVFVVRGDERFTPFVSRDGGATSGACRYGILPRAVDLVRIVAAMNRGDYLSDGSKGSPAGFTVGVAAYPEKHPASPNPEADLASLREKVEAGASWIATQMVFDAESLRRFRKPGPGRRHRCAHHPGLKPLVRAKSLAGVPGTFFVDVPRALVDALTEARSPAEERLAGIRHAAALVERLYDAGAPCVHFFTMGKARDAVETLEAVFGRASGGATMTGLSAVLRERVVIADGATGSLLDVMLGDELADRRDLVAARPARHRFAGHPGLYRSRRGDHQDGDVQCQFPFNEAVLLRGVAWPRPCSRPGSLGQEAQRGFGGSCPRGGRRGGSRGWPPALGCGFRRSGIGRAEPGRLELRRAARLVPAADAGTRSPAARTWS